MVVSTIAELLFGKNFNHRAGITKHHEHPSFPTSPFAIKTGNHP